jgi:hypothetical protein
MILLLPPRHPRDAITQYVVYLSPINISCVQRITASEIRRLSLDGTLDRLAEPSASISLAGVRERV